jgi:Ca-activated chloride channel family protein
MRKILFLVLFCFLLTFTLNAQNVTQGGLEAVGKDGKSLGACPLKNTKVQAEITGFLSRVKVTQEFENNFSEKIEAVYVFPLPQNAAVDDMTMRIGERVVRGKIMRREEAREVYEAAKSNGQIASLLDQERPNIFTQSVANILPGEKIIIEISYVETLKYEDGAYEFVFPMVVGPRYIPNSVADATKITPPIAKERAGHDISIEVILDAGVPIDNIASKSHEIESTFRSAGSSLVKLKDEKTIPNKDFILRYDVAGKKIEDAILTHRSEKGGYFTLILQPPDKVAAQDVTPKEIVFVLDTSGSMSGFPIEKAKESMKLALDGLNPQDTFNLITFAGDTSILFEKPVAATSENLQKAQAFLESRQGSGGTEMMKAIRAALDPSDSQQHLRIVCFMTDGYVGNDTEIIAEIQKHPNARIFSFGIGSSVNRFLLDKMAEEGRGEVEYVSLKDDGSAAAKRFHERVRSPLLTDISVDFGGMQVADVYPKRINDLFSAKPVILNGRFTKSGSGTIRLKGRSFGREIVREIPVNFPENAPEHDVLATLWARTRITDLMSQDYENKNPEIKEAIINLGIEYRLLTQFTSFVAVEERVVTDGGQPRKIEVPVELPEGVDRKSVSQLSNQELPVNGRSFSSNMSYSQTAVVSVSSDSTASIDMTSSSVVTVLKPNEVGYGMGSGSGNGSGGGFQVDGASGSENVFVIDGAEATNFRTGVLNEKNSVPSSGKANKLPKPKFSTKTKWNGSDGLVNVRVAIDETGKVTEAKAESGHESLRAAAEQAALKTKFKIKQSKENPVQIVGVIVYDFTLKDGRPNATVSLKDFAVKLTPEQEKRRRIAVKTAAAVFNLIERLSDPKIQPGTDESKFVADGKAEIIVRLKDLNPETVEELKKSGFEILTEIAAAKAVVGRIAIEKLAGLTELEAVTFISPQYR